MTGYQIDPRRDQMGPGRFVLRYEDWRWAQVGTIVPICVGDHPPIDFVVAGHEPGGAPIVEQIGAH